MEKLILEITTEGRYSNWQSAYEVAPRPSEICENFLQKFKKDDFVKNENKEATPNESILYWKARFTIKIVSHVENKQELEKNLPIACLNYKKQIMVVGMIKKRWDF